MYENQHEWKQLIILKLIGTSDKTACLYNYIAAVITAHLAAVALQNHRGFFYLSALKSEH